MEAVNDSVWKLLANQAKKQAEEHALFPYLKLNLRGYFSNFFSIYLLSELRPSEVKMNSARWSGKTRNWAPIGAVTLNPERDCIVSALSEDHLIQKMAA